MNQIDAFCTNGSSPPRSRFPGYFPGEFAPDVLVSNHGTIFLLKPLTPDAVVWADQHLPPDHLVFGSAIVIEHRFVADIVAGIRDDGLMVRS